MPTRSMSSTANTTSTPAMQPMTMALKGLTVAHDAVIETKPARAPLRVILISGLPTRNHTVNMADVAAAQPDRLVLMAINPKALPAAAVGSAPPVTPVVLPALKPNQPIHRMN